MSGVERKNVGEPLPYRGHEIQPKFMGPDLLCYVDGEEISHFYPDTSAVFEAGRRHIDALEKAKEEEARKNERG